MGIAEIVFVWAGSQDLFRREGGSDRNLLVRDPDRIELRLPASLAPVRSPSAEVSATLDFGKAGCAGFDLASSFRSQFDRQVAEEFLNSLTGDLASNALVLACQISPTICDTIKHYRLTAGALLSIRQGQCQALEDSLSGTPQKIRAGAILSCLADRQRRGWSLDRALEECQRSEEVRDLEGRETQEVRVLEEVARFLKLDDDFRKLLESVGQPIRLGGRTISVNLNLDGIDRAYADKVSALEEKWEEALRSCLKGDSVPPDLLRALSPRGGGEVRKGDLAALAALPPHRRQYVVRNLASLSAFVELSRRLEELDRRLQAMESAPISEGLAPVVRREREWISSELRRLDETFRRQATYHESFARTLDVLDGDLERRFRERWSPSFDERRLRQVEDDTRRWGGKESRTPEPRPGANCGDCGGKAYSLGVIRGK